MQNLRPDEVWAVDGASLRLQCPQYSGYIDTGVNCAWVVRRKPSLWRRVWRWFFLGWRYVPNNDKA